VERALYGDSFSRRPSTFSLRCRRSTFREGKGKFQGRFIFLWQRAKVYITIGSIEPMVLWLTPFPMVSPLWQGLNCGGSRRISDPAPLIWDSPLPLMTDPVPHNWDPAPFCWDPPLCWVESKHQTLLKCHKSHTECPGCSKTPGRRSGTPPLLSALRARASALPE